MRKLYDFPGGVHPAENKLLSNPGQIRDLPLPQRLLIPLAQHIGAPAKPIVAVGEFVSKGQLIAQATGFISANIHATSSGIISTIGEFPVPHASGLNAMCIELQTDGNDSWHQDISPADPQTLSDEQVRQRLLSAGIAGMGGAGFPSAAKLATDKPIHTLLINGVECEPYITADDTLMQAYSQEIVFGANLLLRLLGNAQCLLVIEDNKPQAIAAMQQATETNAGIEVVVIPTKYPSGGEKQLIQNITGKQVPKGGIPADLGVLCQNVATVKAIHDAVYLGQPCIERVITVTGKGVKQAGNYHVRIGTSADYVLQQCQADGELEKAVLGGPMMGFQLPNVQVPLIKTSNCLIVPGHEELPSTDFAMACIRCGQCELACPAQLLPQQLYWLAKSDAFDKIEQYNLMDCIECGACAYVCPSQIPLVQHYRYAKGMVRQQAAEARQAEYAKQRFEDREQRLVDEKNAKEERRKARAVAAAAAQAAKRAASPAGEDPVAAAQARLAAKQAAKPSTGQATTNTETATPAANQPQTASAEPSHKDLKTAAAIVRTKLKKASKALTDAESAGHEETEKLRAMVLELEQRTQQATQALSDFESKLGLDPEAEKKAQVIWAKANAQVRKLTKSPPAEGASENDKDEYKQALSSAQNTLDKALADLERIKNPTQEAN